MLYKFKSKNTGDVIMLEPHGRQVLEIIGKAPGPTGIILPRATPAISGTMHSISSRPRSSSQGPACSALPTPRRSLPFNCSLFFMIESKLMPENTKYTHSKM